MKMSNYHFLIPLPNSENFEWVNCENVTKDSIYNLCNNYIKLEENYLFRFIRILLGQINFITEKLLGNKSEKQLGQNYKKRPFFNEIKNKNQQDLLDLIWKLSENIKILLLTFNIEIKKDTYLYKEGF